MFLKRALGSGSAGAPVTQEDEMYIQVAYPGLHPWRGELACDGVYMIHKTLVEAADGVPACANMAGALEAHRVVE